MPVLPATLPLVTAYVALPLIVETGEEFEGFPTLEDYIRANPPKGLGASVGLIDDLIGKDEKLRTAFYAALRRPDGNPTGANQYQKGGTVDNINSSSEKVQRPTDTSKAYALQKLSDEGQTELLEQVQSGNISANEAMKRAKPPDLIEVRRFCVMVFSLKPRPAVKEKTHGGHHERIRLIFARMA